MVFSWAISMLCNERTQSAWFKWCSHGLLLSLVLSNKIESMFMKTNGPYGIFAIGIFITNTKIYIISLSPRLQIFYGHTKTASIRQFCPTSQQRDLLQSTRSLTSYSLSGLVPCPSHMSESIESVGAGLSLVGVQLIPWTKLNRRDHFMCTPWRWDGFTM